MLQEVTVQHLEILVGYPRIAEKESPSAPFWMAVPRKNIHIYPLLSLVTFRRCEVFPGDAQEMETNFYGSPAASTLSAVAIDFPWRGLTDNKVFDCFL